MSEKQQAEMMINILLQNGFENIKSERFTISHTDILALLELIKVRIISINGD